jgi:hypothetical protein
MHDADDTTTTGKLGPARLWPFLAATPLLASTLLLAAPAAAQPADPPPPAGPPPAAAPPGAASTPWWIKPDARPEEPPYDPEGPGIDVRVRGGISGGPALLMLTGSSNFLIQPAVQLSGRVGIQIGSVFSLYYQNTPVLIAFTDGSGVAFFDHNAGLAAVTLADSFELGFGPSADYVTISTGNLSVSTVLPGLDARVAYHVFHAAHRKGPRRRGISFGLDVQPTFGSGGLFTTILFGVGYEWY